MLKILLASLTNRQYNTLDLMVFMLFAGFMATDQYWTTFFVLMVGSLISALIDVVAQDYLKPKPESTNQPVVESYFSNRDLLELDSILGQIIEDHDQETTLGSPTYTDRNQLERARILIRKDRSVTK